jgi:hypothetical protein
MKNIRYLGAKFVELRASSGEKMLHEVPVQTSVCPLLMLAGAGIHIKTRLNRKACRSKIVPHKPSCPAKFEKIPRKQLPISNVEVRTFKNVYLSQKLNL